jgi:hypothetical protein
LLTVAMVDDKVKMNVIPAKAREGEDQAQERAGISKGIAICFGPRPSSNLGNYIFGSHVSESRIYLPKFARGHCVGGMRKRAVLKRAVAPEPMNIMLDGRTRHSAAG